MEEHAKLVIDEWGCWHPDGSGPSRGGNLFEQQSTMRDAVVAALTLNIFNNNCEKIRMANVAQLVNNLHALFLASGENCIVTPTYYVFHMYKEHQGAAAVRTAVEADRIGYLDKDGREESIPSLSVSASHKDGCATITIANLNAEEDAHIRLEPVGRSFAAAAEMTILSHSDFHAHNTFENPDRVTEKRETIDTGGKITIPKAGIVSIRAQLL